VAADPDKLRFFCDESALGLGKALAAARQDVIHPGHGLIPEVPTGTLDPVWMPIVAKRGLIVIGRDKRIRTKPAELAAFHAHGLRAFWIAGKRDLSNWDALVRMVERWKEIEHIVATRDKGPWFMAINEVRIVEISFPRGR
jgi:hypothetical protein